MTDFRSSTAPSPIGPDWDELLPPVLSGVGLRTVFQPVVDLRGRRVVGYEALTRFDNSAGVMLPPDRWFKAARRLGVGAELEARTLRSAFAHRSSLPPGCFLSVNLEPDHLTEPLVRSAIAEQGNLTGTVIEFTEHQNSDWCALSAPLDELRDRGALIAIDDTGAGHSGLRQVLDLRPSVLKLDRALIEHIDHDEAKVALVEMIGVFANRLDAWVLAEGVETLGEAARLIDLQVPLAQGFLFARPAAPWASLDDAAMARLPRFDDEVGATMHRLVEPAPAVRRGDADAGEWLADDEPWWVVLDDHDRPVGVAPVGARDHVVSALKANISSSPAEVARRVCAAVAEPSAPVVVIDDVGRYAGVVTIRRLLGTLADEGDAER